MLTFNEAYHKLAQFNSDSDIAKFFKEQGIRATRRNTTSCAVSVWMREQTGLKIWSGSDAMGTETELKYTTEAIEHFINRFDSGYYPELEV